MTDTEIPSKWLFQANPDLYDIRTSLANEEAELWNLRQHASEVKTGDRVLIWASGQGGGLLAVGTVLTGPSITSDSDDGLGYWADKRDGLKAKPRVLVRYDRVFEKALGRPFLKNDPILSNMRVITSPRGTNFPVSEREWSELKRWLGDEAM